MTAYTLVGSERAADFVTAYLELGGLVTLFGVWFRIVDLAPGLQVWTWQIERASVGQG